MINDKFHEGINVNQGDIWVAYLIELRRSVIIFISFV